MITVGAIDYFPETKVTDVFPEKKDQLNMPILISNRALHIRLVF